MKKVKKTKSAKKQNQPAYRINTRVAIFGLLITFLIGLFAYGYSKKRLENNPMVVQEELSTEGMTPEEVTINLVTAGKKLPMSDDPVANAMVAAHQVIRKAVKEDKPQDDPVVQKQAVAAAEQAIRQTQQALGNLPGEQRVSPTPYANINTSKNSNLIKVEKENAVIAVNTLQSYVEYLPSGSTRIRKKIDLIKDSNYCEVNNSIYLPDSLIPKDGNVCQMCKPDGSKKAEACPTRKQECIIYKNNNGNQYSLNPSNKDNYKVVHIPVSSNAISLLIENSSLETESARYLCKLNKDKKGINKPVFTKVSN